MLSFMCSITLQSFQKTAGKNGKIKTSVRRATTRGCEPRAAGWPNATKCGNWRLEGAMPLHREIHVYLLVF